LSAQTEPVTAIVEPLLPPPSPKEAIEQVLAASRIVDSAAERTSLLTTVLVGLEREKENLPSTWLANTRTSTEAALLAEAQVDRAYRQLSATTMGVANRRAGIADVRGLERLIASIHEQDAVLGRQRPDAVNALLAAVQDQLDAARRLQLARDRWAMRAADFQQYNAAMQTPMNLFAA